jgi:hypothetical protein
MGDIPRDLTEDRHGPSAYGEQVGKDPQKTPTLVVVAALVLVFGVGLATLALGKVGAGVAVVSAGLLAFGGGMSWLSMERRRARQAERDWFAEHSA